MKMLKTSRSEMRGLLPTLVLLLLGTLGSVACDIDELLKVEIPGQVTEATVNDPELAGLLVNSVIADVECAWNSYFGAAAVHSDEYWQSTGSVSNRRWGHRDIKPDFADYATGSCDSGGYGLYTPLHTARTEAEDFFALIQGFSDADVPRKREHLATIKAYGASTLIAFGEGFCGTPLDGGPVQTPEQLLDLAEQRFTEALELTTGQPALAEIHDLALVSRARARLGLEDYPGAITDAEKVPPGFLFNVTRDAIPQRRQNANRRNANGTAEDTGFERQATVAERYRDVRWKGVKDPRVNVSWDGVSLGLDLGTRHWRHDKHPTLDTPVMLASYREAQMFIAEAAAVTGDLSRARAILNDFHTKAGIPPVTAEDIPTQDDVIRHVIEERRREFFVEGGHRLRDHLRWRGTRFEIPFLGEPGSEHPNGVDQHGTPYADATCLPVPLVEQAGS